MENDIIGNAMALSDQELLARIGALVGREREATAALVAHLAVLELRPNLYRAQGYGTLYAYCTGALRLSEDAACNRIKVTRTCREFPMILDLMAAGTVSLTTVKMLAPHLTAANHQAVLARAANRSRDDIEALVAELAPQPDVKASVRKLPTRGEESSLLPPGLPLAAKPETPVAFPASGAAPGVPEGAAPSSQAAAWHPGGGLPDEHRDPSGTLRPGARPVVRASAPDRYRVQFTINRECYDDLRAVQALLRREIPSGDPGLIFGQALRLLRRKVERAKFAASSSTRRRAEQPQQTEAPGPTHQRRIRPRTDEAAGNGERPGSSRRIPNAVKRAVWWRDRGQCAFVSADGRRCAERAFLELHHIHPYALDGPATVGNIALRCRRHNQYESELIFGAYDPSRVREGAGRRYGST